MSKDERQTENSSRWNTSVSEETLKRIHDDYDEPVSLLREPTQGSVECSRATAIQINTDGSALTVRDNAGGMSANKFENKLFGTDNPTRQT